MRAVVDNREVSQGLGINVNLVSQGVFGLGALLAAFGGVFGCAFTAIYPGMDFQVLPLAFVVVILGGMGSLKGAAVGALVVGFIDNFAKALFPEVSYFSLFLPMAVILGGTPHRALWERGHGTFRRRRSGKKWDSSKRKPLISFRLNSRRWLWIALGAAILLLVVLPPFLPGYIVILMTQSLIFGIVAMSLDVLIGYTRLPALGHAAYFAIGAYTAAILATRYAAGFGACLLSGIGLAVWSFCPFRSFGPEGGRGLFSHDHPGHCDVHMGPHLSMGGYDRRRERDIGNSPAGPGITRESAGQR